MNRVNSSNSNYDIAYNGTNFSMTLKSGATGTNVSGTFLAKAGLDIDLSTTKVLSFTGKTTTDDVLLTIDGTSYKALSTDETISSFLTRVNNANNSYSISYDSTAKRFIATTKNTGVDAGNASGAFLDAAKLTNSGAKLTVANAQNAKFTIDGIAYESTTNSYTSGGLTYTVLKGGSTNVVASKDIDGLVKNIQAFITDYNSIISSINTKTSEKKDSDYPPLTDDQKSAMKDTDITQWEDKAKQGILENDDLITGLGDKLKEAMYSSYSLSDGTKMTLGDFGIGTTSRYDMGVLTVNETKLRTALTDNPDKVMEFFTKQFSTDGLSAGDPNNNPKYNSYNPDGGNTVREQNSGVLVKVFDILSDYVRTNRDSRGNKGFLLEKAGTINDTTDTDNAMYDLIKEQDDMISTMTDKLTTTQDYYYSKFTAMETAISNMNAQASFLSSLSGSSNG